MPIYLLSPSTILVVEVIIKFKNMIDKKIEEAARYNADKYRNYPTLSDEDRDKVSITTLSCNRERVKRREFYLKKAKEDKQ
jgi:hypothetical protein